MSVRPSESDNADAVAPTRSLLAFVIVGGIGFLTDAAFLQLFAIVLQVNIYLARVLAFVPATLVTWLLNRVWAFRVPASSARHKRREYMRYLIVQTCGVTINFAVFSSMVMLMPQLKSYPIVPLAVGSAFGLIVNYTGSRLWVFVTHSVSRDG